MRHSCGGSCFVFYTLHKKWSFPLRISSVNVTKYAENSEFGHIHWRNPQWKIPLFVEYHFQIASNIKILLTSILSHINFVQVSEIGFPSFWMTSVFLKIFLRHFIYGNTVKLPDWQQGSAVLIQLILHNFTKFLVSSTKRVQLGFKFFFKNYYLTLSLMLWILFRNFHQIL